MGERVTAEARAKYLSILNLIENAGTDGERKSAEAAAERMRARYDGLEGAGGSADDCGPTIFDKDVFRWWTGMTGAPWPRNGREDLRWREAYEGRFDSADDAPCNCSACRAERSGERQSIRTVFVNVDGLMVSLQVEYVDGCPVRVVSAR